MSEETVRRAAGDAREFERDDAAALKCPITPLGQRDGRYYFLVASGELRSLGARDMTAPGILSLFNGYTAWLIQECPAAVKKGEDKPSGWVTISAQGLLMRLCAKAGLWDEETQLRGLGVWPPFAIEKDKPPELVIHVGDRLLVGAASMPAGQRLGKAIFPAAPPLERPLLANPATAADAAGLDRHLLIWQARNAGLQRLLMGWICVAALGAAPSWRAHLLFSGPRGCGKSSLVAFLAAALGSQARKRNNFTEAGIRQMLIGEARGLLLDEGEGDTGGGRVAPVIELIRNLSDGVEGVRGGAGGQAQGFQIAASVVLAAINAPQLQPQDRSRITEIEFVPRPEIGREEREAAIAAAAQLAPALWARAVLGWPRFDENLAVYRQALADAGCDPRQRDQLGTLLAGAETLLQDAPAMSDSAAEQIAELGGVIREMIEQDDEQSDARQCFSLLQTTLVDHWRSGARSTLGRMIEKGLDGDQALEEGEDLTKRADVAFREALRIYGLRLEVVTHVVPAGEADAARRRRHEALEALGAPYLVVANGHQWLLDAFARTRWKDGGHARALLRLPGAVPTPEPVRFSGYQGRGICIPADYLPAPLRPATLQRPSPAPSPGMGPEPPPHPGDGR